MESYPAHPVKFRLTEHTNGLLRQHFGKGRSFNAADEPKLARTQRSLHESPRNALGYCTPTEVLGAARGAA